MQNTPLAVYGDILDFIDDPALEPDTTTPTQTYRYIRDGVLVVRDGLIAACGNRSELETALPANCRRIDHRGKLLIPGMVDTHVHYPQSAMIASYGAQLLDWLNQYTFPEEARFADPHYAQKTASFFLEQLIANGTTTALVFGTVHPQSVTAFFEQAQARNMRMICGKVLMDRNAPDELTDTAESGFTESLTLINQWHNKARLGYAITPRFAPTCSPEQLAKAGQLKTQFPDVHIHTHLAENRDECAWVAELFPERAGYLDVYDHYGLLGRRSVFAHGIHLEKPEWQRLAETRSSIAHCPCSNLFIGSGLFPLASADEHGVRVGLGTDVGGGDSFSLLRSINEAYKVQQLQNNTLSPLRSLYMATLGGARALDLEHYIGNFETGKEADFIVLDEHATPLIKRRSERCKSLQERLFVITMLGDDRCVTHTYIQGKEMQSGVLTDNNQLTV